MTFAILLQISKTELNLSSSQRRLRFLNCFSNNVVFHTYLKINRKSVCLQLWKQKRVIFYYYAIVVKNMHEFLFEREAD